MSFKPRVGAQNTAWEFGKYYQNLLLIQLFFKWTTYVVYKMKSVIVDLRVFEFQDITVRYV